jgi:glycosyltransferase involved in cell wall biosynthesis
MPRVAMVIQSYHPHIGGAEKQLQRLIPRLKHLGSDVCVLTRHQRGLQKFEVIDNVPVYRLPVSGPKIISSTSFALSAASVLKKWEPDIIHAHAMPSPGLVSLVAKMLYKIPIIVKVLRGGKEGDIQSLEKRFMGSYFLSALRENVDAFVVISKEIDLELSNLGVSSQKRKFIPNGVNTHHFMPVSAARKIELREKLHLQNEIPVVVYAGRLQPEKQVENLLQIWANFYEDVQSQLLIIGTGSSEAELRAMSGPRVRFIGQVDDVAPYLQAADVFVLPSATEGLSNSLLEAMSCGLAVIATAVGGNLDLVQNDDNGILIQPNDPAALQDALFSILDAPDTMQQLGSRARAHIQSFYSLDSTAEKLVSLYHQLITSKFDQEDAALFN